MTCDLNKNPEALSVLKESIAIRFLRSQKRPASDLGYYHAEKPETYIDVYDYEAKMRLWVIGAHQVENESVCSFMIQNVFLFIILVIF